MTGLVFIVSLVGLGWISFSNNFELMLPADDEVIRSIQFLQDSNFANKVVLSIKKKSPDVSTSDLIHEVDKLADSFEKPIISKVTTGLPAGNIMGEVLGYLDYLPQILTEDDLKETETKLSKENIEKEVGRIYRQVLSPKWVYASLCPEGSPWFFK